MNHIETLTRYITAFVDGLVQNGLREVVISPGSRSTPLAMTFREHEKIKEWVIIDERSAAFFALGMAKENNRPVALVCTSGTAAANYFPAIIEAYHSRVPMLVLTSDRPHELRDIGAPQAMDQIKLYGDYVKWFHEMALPEATEEILAYTRSKAARSLYLTMEGNSGPVHLNFPFREPLIPDFTLENLWDTDEGQPYQSMVSGVRRLAETELLNLVHKLEGKQKGLIVCGPQTDKEFPEAVVKFAETWELPILADPLSQVRAGSHSKTHIIEGYDAILRDGAVREQLKPDFIIRFGAMPVSKMYLFLIEDHPGIKQFIIEDEAGHRDPTNGMTEFIYAHSSSLCYDLVKMSDDSQTDTSWLKQWQQMNEIAKKHLFTEPEKAITEGEAIIGLLDVIPENSSLYVGNSMAIRDIDTFFMTTDKNISILGNRGVNGIDGVVSSALGATTSNDNVTLVLGDLSFYHDLNGLLAAKHYDLNITILVVNNDGGGIFSFLPQVHNKKHFEPLFGTPLGIDFKHTIEMYGGDYSVADTVDDLKEKLSLSYLHKGLSVIEVKTDREANIVWHRKKWEAINNDLLAKKW